MLNSPKTNILTYGLIEITSSVLDEIASKNVQKDKDNDQIRKKNTANKQSQSKIQMKILSFLKIHPMQKEFSPSYKPLDFGYE